MFRALHIFFHDAVGELTEDIFKVIKRDRLMRSTQKYVLFYSVWLSPNKVFLGGLQSL